MTGVRQEILANEVARCRAGIANMLMEAVAMTRRLERRLNVTGGWREATARIDLDADPAGVFRIYGALLLRKARIHTVAVLRANETSNLHSLAVQMRPVLECAGQVVFQFHNLFIAPNLLMSQERALELLCTRMDSDHYHTLLRITKGGVSPEELRQIEARAQEAAAAAVGATKPKRRKKRRFTQADKVASLPMGPEWYNHLSDHFSHATAADWRGPSGCGGVISIGKVQDEFAFLGLMDYLVNQVAFMNAAAALCPVEGGTNHHWKDWVEPTLAQLSHVRESSKAHVDAARLAMTEGIDESTRTD